MRGSSSSRPVGPGDEHESGCWSALQVNHAGPGRRCGRHPAIAQEIVPVLAGRIFTSGSFAVNYPGGHLAGPAARLT
jgi:hypothetical protein